MTSPEWGKFKMPNYSIVRDYLVDRRSRDVAESASCIACEKLATKQPQRSWIVEVEHGEIWISERISGWCAKDGRTIFIRHDCSPFEIASTIAHECRHCWQIQNPSRFPIPGKTYTRDMNHTQKERDARLFELEFWGGKENRNGSFDDILRILTDMRIASARALIRAASQQYAPKPRIIGLPCASYGVYPFNGKTKLIVPSERQMEENLLQHILNG